MRCRGPASHSQSGSPHDAHKPLDQVRLTARALDEMRPAGTHGEDEIAPSTAAALADRAHHFPPSDPNANMRRPCSNRGENPVTRRASAEASMQLDKGDQRRPGTRPRQLPFPSGARSSNGSRKPPKTWASPHPCSPGSTSSSGPHGDLAMSGQLVDASIVAAPKQRNTKAEKQAIREGRVPEDWQDRPAKRRQKDRDARWTVKTRELDGRSRDPRVRLPQPHQRRSPLTIPQASNQHWSLDFAADVLSDGRGLPVLAGRHCA